MLFLRVTLNDYLKKASTDIISILSNPLATEAPSLLVGENANQAIYKIAKLLKRINKILNLNESNNVLAHRIV